MRTLARSVGIAAVLAFGVGVAPAAAQAVHSFTVGAGGLFPRGFDARVDEDVLVANLTSAEPLLFDIGRFRGGQILGEWNLTFADRVEVSGGIGFYQRTVPSIYRDLENDNGFDIAQDLKLRMVPVTAIVRFLPVGRPHEFQPYVGVGVAAINWRYSEAGEFVDENFDIFGARFVETGTSPGAVFVLGARVPIDGDIYGLTLEYRYIRATGDTGGFGNGFLGDKIDLTHGSFNVGFLIRF